MPSIVKTDLWWLDDPHRAAYVDSALLGPDRAGVLVYNLSKNLR
jgi:hypothetical protein